MAINYLEIKKQIRQKLSKPIDFEDTDNLLELGLSSLVIMKLVNQWRKQGIKISFGVLMEHPTLREWWELIQKTLEKADSKKRTAKKEKRIMADMYQEFPLTDVQYAYWVGRDERQALGGIGCHAYLEFDGKAVDQSRLRHAWAVVQQHHPMLRACFLNNGAQKILAKPYKGELKINDYSSMQEEEAQRAALSIRNRLSHRKLHIEKGEVAGLELTLLPHGKTRLHIDVDLLVADVQSLHILLRDIFTVYNGGELPQESKEWNFATYLKEQETEENEEKERAKEYWNGRLETLPKGPDLPLAKRPEEIQKPIFKRRVVRIQKREWENLQNRAKEYQTTQAMLLLTAYSAVLERWSRNKRFLVNIPYFNRKTEKTGLEDVIADFTTLLLLEVNCDGKPTFLELLHRIEKQLHEDMKNTSYSGVQVQRDMSKLHGEASVSAPIVFACNLGTPLVNSEFQKCIGKFSYMISQTPQVWIDFQSYEDEEGIQLTWDSVDELFPEFMIQDMINSFEKLLHRLETENWEQKFDVLPENRKKFLEKLCDVGTPEQPLKKEIKLDFDHYPVKAYTYSFPGQYGTHVDVPAHADKTGRTLEKIQLKECVMPLCVIDCSQKVAENNDYSLKLNDIIEYEKTYCKIPTGAFVAMRSDWYKRWPNQKSFQNCDENGESHYPGWSFEAVKFLVEEREIGGIGHETFDTDPPADIMQRNFKAECYILKQDKFQIEMLANLDKVPAYGAVICCMFVKQTLGTGFPARCFAVCPE